MLKCFISSSYAQNPKHIVIQFWIMRLCWQTKQFHKAGRDYARIKANYPKMHIYGKPKKKFVTPPEMRRNIGLAFEKLFTAGDDAS